VTGDDVCQLSSMSFTRQPEPPSVVATKTAQRRASGHLYRPHIVSIEEGKKMDAMSKTDSLAEEMTRRKSHKCLLPVAGCDNDLDQTLLDGFLTNAQSQGTTCSYYVRYLCRYPTLPYSTLGPALCCFTLGTVTCLSLVTGRCLHQQPISPMLSKTIDFVKCKLSSFGCSFYIIFKMVRLVWIR